MWTRRQWMAATGIVVLTGCATGPGDGTYESDPRVSRFYDEDWIYYYDEDDEDFLAGLTDEQKDVLKQKWDSLSPEEKEQVRDRWNELSNEERSHVREAWNGLNSEQRQQVVASMQSRIRSGTLRPVTPIQAGPSRFQARSDGGFDWSGGGARTGSFDRGSYGGSLGSRGFGGGLGGRGGRR